MEILAKAGHRDGDEGQINESVRTVELFSLSQCANNYNFSCCHEMFIVCILKHCPVSMKYSYSLHRRGQIAISWELGQVL